MGKVFTDEARKIGESIIKYMVTTLLKDFVGALFELTVDHDAIDDRERSVVNGFNMRVMPRRARVVKHNRVIGRAPNHAGGSRV